MNFDKHYLVHSSRETQINSEDSNKDSRLIYNLWYL